MRGSPWPLGLWGTRPTSTRWLAAPWEHAPASTAGEEKASKQNHEGIHKKKRYFRLFSEMNINNNYNFLSRSYWSLSSNVHRGEYVYLPGWRCRRGSWPKNQPRGRQAAWAPGATVPAPEEWPGPSSRPTRCLTGDALLFFCAVRLIVSRAFRLLVRPRIRLSLCQIRLGRDVIEITELDRI